MQTRNHLQKARVPASPALWCAHQEVQHACFIAGWMETGALKAEFQMTAWETVRRGFEEFNGLLVREMPCSAHVWFHVQLCLCSLDVISDSKEPDKISCCRAVPLILVLIIALKCKLSLNTPWHQPRAWADHTQLREGQIPLWWPFCRRLSKWVHKKNNNSTQNQPPNKVKRINTFFYQQ